MRSIPHTARHVLSELDDILREHGVETESYVFADDDDYFESAVGATVIGSTRTLYIGFEDSDDPSDWHYVFINVVKGSVVEVRLNWFVDDNTWHVESPDRQVEITDNDARALTHSIAEMLNA